MAADLVRALIVRVLCSALLLLPLLVQAHPLAPGLLAINERSSGEFSVLWKIPLKRPAATSLTPVLPQPCSRTESLLPHVAGNGRVQGWQMRCQVKDLAGQRLGVEGLQPGQPGVLLRVQLEDGRFFHQMLSAETPTFELPTKASPSDISFSYLELGFEHLLTGIDHILFVLILTLLIGRGRALLWTITLFTLGHSVTLSLAVLGYVDFPSQWIEALIALSITLGACELLLNPERRLLRRYPGLLSGSFGLLHGMGFAGALSEVGLPSEAIPLALAAFNVGIELGQLMVISLFCLLLWLGTRLLPQNRGDRCGLWLGGLRWLTAYGIGGLSTFWFWQRLAVF